MPFGLGAKARTPDIRDYKIGHSQAPVTLPLTYLPDHSNLPVKMQGQFGTCGGHAGAAWSSFTRNLDLSPKYLWKQIATQSHITSDVGTDMRTIFKTLQNTGDCHETLCPDTLDATFQAYSDASALTDAMLNDAYPYGASNYAFTDNPMWDEIRQAIFQNGGAILLVDCGDGWWANGWSEGTTCPLKLGSYVDGHFILAWGYDENYIYFRNSWSDQWGRKGDGYFGRDYLPHVKEMGIGIDAPSTKQQLVSLYTKLVYALQQLVVALKPSPAASVSQSASTRHTEAITSKLWAAGIPMA